PTTSISTLPTTSPPPLLVNTLKRSNKDWLSKLICHFKIHNWPYCSVRLVCHAWRSVLGVWCLVFAVPLKEYLYYNTNRITFYSSAASVAVTAAAANGAVAEIEDVAEDADVVTDEHDEADDDKAVATKEATPVVSSCVTSASRCKSFSLMRAKRCCCCCRH
uniref:F-box domain-containing protein n=1 Tax=Glossina austeni TaxID=7395 RepID=A0A1A9VTK8_GLOAU